MDMTQNNISYKNEQICLNDVRQQEVQQTSVLTNVFKVIDEYSLDEILSDNKRQLVLIIFTANTINNSEIKKCLLNLAKQHTDAFFTIIDVDKFANATYKYVRTAKPLPKASFYFGFEEVANIYGTQTDSFVNDIRAVFQSLKNELNERSISMSEKSQTDRSFDHSSEEKNTENIIRMQQLKQFNNLEAMHKMIQLQKKHNIEQLQQIQKIKELEERSASNRQS